MFISAPKSLVTLFCQDPHQAKTHPRILIEDSPPQLVQCSNILGVYHDTSLSFNKHSQQLPSRESIQQKQYPQCLLLLLSTHSLDPCLWGSPIIPLLVHQPAYLSIWPAAPSPQRGLSTNPGVTVWCVCGCS